MPDERPEIPACAAIRRIDENGYEIILAGHRHGDCLSAANVSGLGKLAWEQGFMTTHGRFVGRKIGYHMMQSEGIPSASPDGYRTGLRELFSEDLY